jgi:hypothetical protein
MAPVPPIIDSTWHASHVISILHGLWVHVELILHGTKNHVISNIRVTLILCGRPVPPSLWAATHTAMPPLTISPMVRVACGRPDG